MSLPPTVNLLCKYRDSSTRHLHITFTLDIQIAPPC